MSEPVHYSLQGLPFLSSLSPDSFLVIRLTEVQRKPKDTRLYVELKLANTVYRTGDIDDNGEPGWHTTFTFSQLDDSAIFSISANRSRRLIHDRRIGDVSINVAQLLQESAQHDVQLILRPTHLLRIGIKDPVSAVAINLSFKRIDAVSRANIDIEAAEQSIRRIKTSAEKADSSITVVGLLIEAMDVIVEVVDIAAEIHPVFKVSWKAASALYKLVSYQFNNDKKLIDMVDKMRKAYDFSNAARCLDDKTELLKPTMRKLLDVTIECSQFVQEYAKHNVAGRTARVSAKEDIDEFAARFVDLREELDSVIGLNAAVIVQEIQQQQQVNFQVVADTRKVVIDIELKQQLDALKDRLDLSKYDPADVSALPRCLQGTRQEYLDPIMGFLSSDTAANVLWLTGAAGSGKSTIAVTASDRCGETGWEAAHLFFQRERGNNAIIIRVIAYKLAVLHPSVATHIIRVIENNKNIIDLPLSKQFEKLLLEPLLVTAEATMVPVIIILDALDECGSVEQRRDLLRVLRIDFPRLPPTVRVLVTSRPESDIMEGLTLKSHIRHISLEHKSEDSRRDVALYIDEEMPAALRGKPPKGWAWEDLRHVLTVAADGLFIWASTSVKMVRVSSNPGQKLATLLGNIQSVELYGIDSLYATALKESGISWDEPESKEQYMKILGLILVAKEAMPGEAIETFLGLEEETVECTLGRLRAVLLYEPGQAVRLHHTSFADYLFSPERSGSQPWHIDELSRKQDVTERCFDIMGQMLHFNICGLESSFERNKDVMGLHGRIKERVPPNLDYACRFWAIHICELPLSTNFVILLDKVKTFTDTHLMYWFEVLSLTGHFHRVVVQALYEASLWFVPIDVELSSFLWAAYRLASVFAYPISESAPQIYLSAISLWKAESHVADHYSRIHPCLPVHRYGLKPPAQCIQTMKGHKHEVTSVAFSPDGKRVVSGSRDMTVCIWDAVSGELVSGPFQGHTGWVRSVAFSPDGTRIVSGSDDKTVRIWDAVSGELVSDPFTGHTNGVSSVAFSQDGKRVVSGSDDKTLRIWDVNNGKLSLGPFKGHTGRVWSVAFSPDGNHVASGSGDSTVRVWDASNGELVAGPFEGHTDEVNSVAFSPDGKRIVSGSDDETVRIWDAHSGKPVSGPFKGHKEAVNSVAFSPDGRRLVSGSWDKTIRIWDMDSGELFSGPFEHTDEVNSVAFSSDGMRVVSGSDDRTVRVWDADSGRVVAGRFEGHTGWVRSVAFSPCGTRIVSGSDDNLVCIWDTDSGELVLDPLEGHSDRVSSVAFSPDGKRIVSGSEDMTVRVWDADSGEVVWGIQAHPSSVYSVAFSPDGRYVVSGSDSMAICVWDADSGELVSGPFKGHEASVYSVAFSPDGSRIASSSGDGTVRVWDAHSGELVSGPFEGHANEVNSVAFSPDGKYVLSGSGSRPSGYLTRFSGTFSKRDNTIRVWDANSGELIRGPFWGHANAINSVAFSPNGKLIVSGSQDSTIRVWDVPSSQPEFRLLCGHFGWVNSVTFSPDGNRILSSSNDRTIRMWDIRNEGADLGQVGISTEVALPVSSFPSSSVGTTKDAMTEKCEGIPRCLVGRSIRSWTMDRDGWIVTEKGELLTWMPEDMRRTLWGCRNSAVFNCEFSTKLDFSDAPVGVGWHTGFPRRE